MSKVSKLRQIGFVRRAQRGVATLLVTLVLLVILTIIVLASTNVALFEQKTATNENRQHLAEQAAEYALNVAGEYLKVKVSKLSTNSSGGWLSAGTIHWMSCAGITDTTHPCLSEKDATLRAQLYYYVTDGAAHTAGSAAELNLPYDSLAPSAIKLATTGAGGTSAFGTSATVRALLCRVDSSLATAACRLAPVAGQRIAVTLISSSTLAGENAAAVIKESWGTLSTSSFSSNTPLVAAGTVNFVGSFTIVDSPNAGGYGANASVWSPSTVGGNGSWQTCHAEDYLGSYPESQLYTNPGCADIHANPKCLCDGIPIPETGPNAPVMSKGGAPDGPDILDKDGNQGELPDITFFPGASDISSAAQIAATRMDYRVCTGAGAPYADCVTAGACPPSHTGCLTDDNLFEWTFGVDVTGGDSTVVQTNCSFPATFDPTNSHPGDCEIKALYDLGFKTVADCSGLNAASSGLIYVTGLCTLPNVAQVGSLAKPVIMVVDNDVTVGHTDLFYGMLFIRSPNTATTLGNAATISGNANGKWFGSIVLEGGASHMDGTMDLVYMDTSAGSPDDPLPDSTRFARLPGSWLDSASGF